MLTQLHLIFTKLMQEISYRETGLGLREIVGQEERDMYMKSITKAELQFTFSKLTTIHVAFTQHNLGSF